MKKLFIVLISIIAMPISASAQEGGWHHHFSAFPYEPDPNFNDEMPLPGVFDGKPMKDGPCADLKLDASQKSKLKDAFFKHKEHRIDLNASAEKARLHYHRLLTDPKADLKAAQEASAAVIEAGTNIYVAREAYKNEVLFQILKPEQREPALRCSHHPMPHPGMHHGVGEGSENPPPMMPPPPAKK